MSKAPVQSFPLLLNKSDALLYAAERLDKMVGDMRLLHILSATMLKPGFGEGIKQDAAESAEHAALLADLKAQASGIVDVDIQEQAMRSAAEEIRTLAHEQKLVEARAAALGTRAPISSRI